MANSKLLKLANIFFNLSKYAAFVEPPAITKACIEAAKQLNEAGKYLRVNEVAAKDYKEIINQIRESVAKQCYDVISSGISNNKSTIEVDFMNSFCNTIKNTFSKLYINLSFPNYNKDIVTVNQNDTYSMKTSFGNTISYNEFDLYRHYESYDYCQKANIYDIVLRAIQSTKVDPPNPTIPISYSNFREHELLTYINIDLTGWSGIDIIQRILKKPIQLEKLNEYAKQYSTSRSCPVEGTIMLTMGYGLNADQFAGAEWYDDKCLLILNQQQNESSMSGSNPSMIGNIRHELSHFSQSFITFVVRRETGEQDEITNVQYGLGAALESGYDPYGNYLDESKNLQFEKRKKYDKSLKYVNAPQEYFKRTVETHQLAMSLAEDYKLARSSNPNLSVNDFLKTVQYSWFQRLVADPDQRYFKLIINNMMRILNEDNKAAK